MTIVLQSLQRRRLEAHAMADQKANCPWPFPLVKGKRVEQRRDGRWLDRLHGQTFLGGAGVASRQ